jgi:hypothetical protein
MDVPRVLLDTVDEGLLVVGLDDPSTFTFNSLLHVTSPWRGPAGVSIFAGRVW